jgi:hypothetical protein
MSTPIDPDAATPPRSTRWIQPIPPRTDENIKFVHRKIDQNLKPGQPGIAAGSLPDRSHLPGMPSLMAQLAQPRSAVPPDVRPEAQGPSTNPVATPPAEPEDVLAKAWEERMAKQWEDVTARLCRDFAPAGGADTETVLAHIAEQRKVLDSATVRDYLPVLVDRAVRKLLSPDENTPS